jgi:5'-3' exonuclease
MGIKNLNRYLKKYSTTGIKNITIKEIQNKTIVVDTSIYLYKYLEQNALLESFFIMVTEFRCYNITPLFIFDGKPDESKMELLWKRVYKKQEALKEFHDLKYKLNTTLDIDEIEKDNIIKKIEQCRKKSTRVKETDVIALKELFDIMGVYYYDAPMEADVVCAYFVKSGKAWACMSDDMDMFVYGCHRVLREWRIEKKFGLLYETATITKEIKVHPSYLTALLLLLGSDYLQDICKEEHIQINQAFQWYNEFIECNPDLSIIRPMSSFYNWLQKTQKITKENKDKLLRISIMYDVPNYMEIPTINEKNVIWTHLQKLMAPYGFIIGNAIS